jgi:signal transduction histidine kinase
MRYTLVLITLALVFMLLSFYYQDHLVREPVDKAAMEKIENLKREFLELHAEILRFSVADLPQVSRDEALVDPAKALPRSHLYSYAQIQVLHRGEKTCEWPRGIYNLHQNLQKAVIWQQYLCKQISRLPAGFFSLPPFLHPSGFSYVYLARKSGLSQFQGSPWLRRFSDRLHILELAKVSKLVSLSKTEEVMLDFAPEDWGLILAESEVLMTKTFILFKAIFPPRRSRKHSVFRVFKRSDWKEFLVGTGFSTTEGPRRFTVHQDGELAWEPTPTHLDPLSRRYRLLSLVTVVLLGVNLIIFMIREIRRRVHDQQQRLLILQTLTHELRTPIAAMQLSLEPFRSHFDDLCTETQGAFFKMTQGVHRLKRVIEASTQYLRSEGVMGEIQFHPQKCPSLNDFFQEMISEQGVEVAYPLEFQGLEPDQGFCMDPYWVQVAVQNLLDNANKHGVSPVSLGLEMDSKYLRILVQDQGVLSKSDFQKFLSPFSCKDQGEGLGLGLTLVEKITSEMGGRLEFEENPTRFKIIIKRESQEPGQVMDC